jgi:hypothetical protein
MKHVDYLYFNIYNYFYRISQYRQSVNVRIQAMYLFSIGSGGWLLLMESLYLHMVRHSWFPSKAESAIFAACIYLLTAVLSNYIFIINERDQVIFGKYEEWSNQNPKQKRHFSISVCVLLIPYLVLISFAIFMPKHL